MVRQTTYQLQVLRGGSVLSPVAEEAMGVTSGNDSVRRGSPMAATRTWRVIVMMLIVMVWMMTGRRGTMSVVRIVTMPARFMSRVVVRIVTMSARFVPRVVVRIVVMPVRFVSRVVVRFLVRTTRFFTLIMRLVLVITRLSSLVVSV